MAAKKGRRAIPNDVKQRAIERVQAGERRVVVAKEIGISLPTINNWMAAVAGSAKKRVGRQDDTGELELLRLENEYLKKKIAYLESRAK